MKQLPVISVLMPVYNCEEFIEASIKSILNQSFSNFEFIIIDDASNDNTLKIIKELNDPRIRLVEKTKNSGYSNSLNIGLKLAKGEFIARMDGDDISILNRFEKQLAFMKTHPEVIVCGTGYSVIGNEQIKLNPEMHEQIKLGLLRGNCIVHPSVLMRNSVIKEYNLSYNPNMEPSEDYDFWVRLLAHGKLHNLPEVLINYRIHGNSVSRKKAKQQESNAALAKINLLEYLGLELSIEEKHLLKKIFKKFSSLTIKELKKAGVILKRVENSNDNFFQRDGFQDYLQYLQEMIFFKFINRYERYNPAIFLNYMKIKDDWDIKLDRYQELKLLMKSFLYYRVKYSEN